MGNTLAVQVHFPMLAREDHVDVFVSMFLQPPSQLVPFAVGFAILALASIGWQIRDAIYDVLECFGVL